MGSPTRRASTRASEGSRDRFRDGGDSDLEAVGAACGPPELLKLAAEQNPDVVVTDTGMPPTGTDEGTRASATSDSRRRPQPVHGARLRAGTPVGRLGRPRWLLPVARSSTRLLWTSIQGPGSAGASPIPSGLHRGNRRSSPRWPKGKSNGTIAESLGACERTVEQHSDAIFSKLGLSEERDVNRRVKAVLVHLSAQSGG